MKHHVLAAVFLCGLFGSAAGAEPGWFLETPGAATQEDNNAMHLRPLKVPQQAGRDILNLRAGFRFGPAFSLSAGLDEYLLDTAGRPHCSSTDFVCLAGRDRAIDYGTAYSFSLAPAIQLDDELSIYGHLGVQGWSVQHGGDEAASRRELLFGIGLGYDVSNPFRLQLEYRSMDLDIKLTSIGFTWRF